MIKKEISLLVENLTQFIQLRKNHNLEFKPIGKSKFYVRIELKTVENTLSRCGDARSARVVSSAELASVIPAPCAHGDDTAMPAPWRY